MERLWAPWRMSYIKNVDQKEEGCIFCTKPVQDKDRENLILFKGEKCFVIMNLYPYNNGHLMVVPYEHTADILTLDKETTFELWQLIGLCKQALSQTMQPEGFNIGMNIGRVAGAGIDQHIHMHIVPRWNGDTNFMPVIGDTKIISQSMSEAYELLEPVFRSMAGTILEEPS